MDKDQKEIELYKQAYFREKKARKEAEKLLENKALELFNTNQELIMLNEGLEQNLERRVDEIKAMANFYLQNPNPVIRINGDFEILFRNEKGLSILAEIEQNRENRNYTFFRQTISDCLKSGNESTLVNEIGGHFFQLTFIPFTNESFVNIYGIDISNQIAAERARQESELNFRDYIETAEDIIYQTDLTGQVTYVNPSVTKITGYLPEEFISQNIRQFISSTTLLKAIKIHMDQLKNGTGSTYFEFEFITKSGKKRWLGQKAKVLQKNGRDVGFLVFARDIHENKILQAEIERSEEKYRGILENLELGLIEVNNEGVMTKVYESFCKLTGYSEKELIGNKPEDFLLHPESKKKMQEVETLRNKGVSSVYEVQIKHKNGNYLWIIISGAPYYDQEGNKQGTIGVHVDITERKKLENELNEAKEIAQASAKAKEMFLANMSHEIRTPLNAVIGVGQLLANTQLTSQQTNLLDKIQISAQSLLRLVNDILDLTKVEKGEMIIENKANNICDCINELISTLEYSALKKELKLFSEHINVDRDDWRLFDRLRLSQVLLNLTSNAIKFTEKGEVKVRFGRKSRESNVFFFEVTDTGIGISKKNLSTIFNEFKQAEDNTTRKYGGTGLGLSISKKIISLLGGELRVESELGKGSKFWFEITLEQTNQPKENLISESEISLNDFTFLMAEDNEFNQFVAEKMIEESEGEIITFGNGKLLIDFLKENPDTKYDLILMDIQMPEMNGLETVQYLRNQLGIEKPIIALTANAVKSDIDEYLKVGMNDYVSKPFDRNVFKSTLAKYLDNKHTPPILNLAKLEEMGGGDIAFRNKMLKIFHKEGLASLEILRSNSKEQLKQIAHKIKPSLDILGNQKIQKLTRLIEEGNHDPLDEYIQMLSQLLDEVADKLQD
ncbi:MAG: PAS domain S-box protein [Crocinitomicaceae bacterium]|nr:PAS domain S-box protein [Crocinitomicaceae bacterium]